MQLWTAFALGLVGSLHCAGMCGPLVLALPVAPGRWGMHLTGKLAYHAGRILTYATLGLLFGGLGQLLGLAGWQRWISVATGTAILLGLSAWPLRHTTGFIARPVGFLKAILGRLLRQHRLPAQFAFGAVNGLLPCGLVYWAGAAATTTGDALGGARYMTLFGLGTVPMMLGLALAGRLLHLRLQRHLRQLVPVSFGLLAALLILRGLNLGIPYVSPHIDPTTPANASCCGSHAPTPAGRERFE